jgi:hypothetical protein
MKDQCAVTNMHAMLVMNERTICDAIQSSQNAIHDVPVLS